MNYDDVRQLYPHEQKPAAPIFEAFPKIPRWSSTGVITEKLDGTNAQVIIRPTDGTLDPTARAAWDDPAGSTQLYDIFAASRNRIITPEDDNYGFAKWVYTHATELVSLGEGRHFGEWWGPGIQRGYGLVEKKFALFNTVRWNPQNPNRPACCDVVPTLYSGEITGSTVDDVMQSLLENGSVASPGFMRPEGIILYVHNSRSYFKETFEHRKGKWAVAA